MRSASASCWRNWHCLIDCAKAGCRLRSGLLLLAALLIHLAWRTYWPHAGFWDVAPMVIGWRTLLAAAAAALLAALLVAPTDSGWPMRLLSPLLYLGKISYGIYLWHMPVLLTLLATSPWRGRHLLFGTLAGTLVLAAFSWQFIERHWLAGKELKARAW